MFNDHIRGIFLMFFHVPQKNLKEKIKIEAICQKIY